MMHHAVAAASSADALPLRAYDHSGTPLRSCSCHRALDVVGNSPISPVLRLLPGLHKSILASSLVKLRAFFSTGEEGACPDTPHLWASSKRRSDGLVRSDIFISPPTGSYYVSGFRHSYMPIV